MKGLLRAACLLLGLGLIAPTAAQDVLSEAAFTDAYIRELGVQAPDLEVRKVDAMHLKVQGPKGRESKVFLDNAYQTYLGSPESQADIIATQIAALLESLSASGDRIDTSRIVPVIKDVNYIPEMREGWESRGNAVDDWEAPAHEPYNAELVILYAEDTDLNVRYLSEEKLIESGFPTAGRRARALENLKTLLPEVEALRNDGIFMLSAGGNYETSLLLFDDIWRSGQLPVQGDLVVAIPARDLLLVTGSQDLEGLAKVEGINSEVMESGVYTLTDQLFVYRDGRFVPFGS